MYSMVDPELEEPEVETCEVCEHAVDSHDRRAEDGDCFACPRDDLVCCQPCGRRHRPCESLSEHDDIAAMIEVDEQMLSWAN
jgi:hypothetical protein